MRSLSISLRLAIWYTGISFVGIFLCGYVMWFALGTSVLSWKDRTLEMRASRVRSVAESTSSAQLALRLDELVGILPEGELIEIRDSQGVRLFPAAEGNLLALSVKPCERTSISNVLVGRSYFRVLCSPLRYNGRAEYLLVPSSLLEDQILSHVLTTRLIQMASLMLIVSSLAGYTLSRRSLRPVDVLVTKARSMTAKDLTQRLPIPAADDELKRLALEWNNLLARIEVSLKRVEQFTADASHELRSPIAFIRATAQDSLLHGHLSEEARDALQAILDETTDTAALLEDLLTLARADAAHNVPTTRRTSVSQAIVDVCDRFRPSAEQRGQTLRAILPNGEGPTLLVHEADLRRLMGILLDNAIKYTPPGGTISIAYETRNLLQVSVSDTGLGIAPEHQDKVFDRFFRVDTARSASREGSGLGLAIAKCLVERYNGTIALESELGKGTIVTFSLPRS